MATRILPSPRRPDPAHVLAGPWPFLPFFPLVATLLSPLSGRIGGGRVGLAAGLKDPLDDCDDGADRDDREGGGQDREVGGRSGDDEPETQDDEPDLAGHDADGSHPDARREAE